MRNNLLYIEIEEQVKLRPNKVAIEEGESKITYEGLSKKSNQLCHLLRDYQIERGDIVGVIIPSSIRLVISLLGVFKSGGVYLPMDIKFSRKRLNEIFIQNKIKVLVTNSDLRESVWDLMRDLNIDIPVVEIDSENKFLIHEDLINGSRSLPGAEYSDESVSIVSEGGDSSYIYYTSGSTGEAKGIIGRHDSLSHFIHWEQKEFSIDSEVRVSQLIQITFDASLRDILLPLCSGGTLCIAGERIRDNALKLIEWIESQQISLIHTVPSLFRVLTRELELKGRQTGLFNQLKYVLLSGEALYSKDIQRWRAVVGEGVEIVNLYGATETTMIRTFHRIKEVPEDEAELLPVGKPIDDTFIAIINDNMPCLPGEIGEIYIKTPYWTKGYINDRQSTERVFVQNPLIKNKESIVYKTGDLGRYLKDGSIEVLGRVDSQVKVNGIRIELGEIEKAVRGIEGVEEVVVLVHKREDNGNELICYYTGKGVEEELLKQGLKEELNANVVPGYFVKLEEFPLNINGKIDKKQLPKPEELLMSSVDYEEASTELERTIEKIWKEVLGIERIGVNTSFFKVGGTSLKVIQVISRLYEELNVSLIIADVFHNPTVRLLSFRIKESLQGEYKSIEAIEEQDHYAVSPSQKRLWVLNQFEREQVAYNITEGYILKGRLNRSALIKSFERLVSRHEILRTNFVTVSGEPRQKIHNRIEEGLLITYTDIRDVADKRSKAKELVEKESNHSFDICTDALVRLKLIQVEEDEYVLTLTTHHIISDGWSTNLLADEILKLYNSIIGGSESNLGKLKIQYKDYVSWQDKKLKEKFLEYQQYWKRTLSGEIPVLELPTDFKRPRIQTFTGSRYSLRITKELSEQINRVCKEEEVTLFVYLLASIKVLLYRYSGQRDIIIGTPSAGRDHKDLEDQIGFYVRTLAIRTQFDPEVTFKSFLKQVKAGLLEAQSHSLYPFDKIVEDLNLEKNPSRSSLFDVMVQIQDTEMLGRGAESLGEVRVSKYAHDLSISKFDLTFDIKQEAEEIAIEIEYNTALFGLTTIEKTGNDLVEIITMVMKNNIKSLKDIKYSFIVDQQDQLNYLANFLE